MSDGQDSTTKAGQRLALVIAGVALAWIALNFVGSQMGWSNRTRAFFDLAALAGFGWAFWIAIGIWRSRQKDEG
ncbi:MAG: DUF5337 domain-containing protein [Pseudomonadota bacterium]